MICAINNCHVGRALLWLLMSWWLSIIAMQVDIAAAAAAACGNR